MGYQLQLDGWFDEHANPRMHKTLHARPIDRLIEERAVKKVGSKKAKPAKGFRQRAREDSNR